MLHLHRVATLHSALATDLKCCLSNREPEKSKGPIPFHLVPPLVRSLSSDHFVSDKGNIVYYQKDPNYWQVPRASMVVAHGLHTH